MLFVILFHVALDRGDPFYGLRRCGNVGVDIFLFLSGVGLWFAWTKTPSVSYFYRRRLIRILPTWLICSTAFYLPDYLGAQRFSKNVVDLIGDITINWDFWLHDELTFWYVPAIMLLYLIAPWYMRLIVRYPTYRWLPLLMVVWCVMVQWVLPIHAVVGHLEIFWSRVPIFFIGINMGEMVRSRRQLPPDAVWLLLITSTLHTVNGMYSIRSTKSGKSPWRTRVGESLVPHGRYAEPRSLSHTYPFRTGVCATHGLWLLGNVRRNSGYHAACSVGAAEGYEFRPKAL